MGKGKPPLTPLLPPAAVAEALRELPEWRLVREEDGPRLQRRWTLADFDAAMALLEAVAGVARRIDHHPDLHLTEYKRVRVATWSHDAGGVTARDLELATAVDRLPAAVAAN